MSKNLIDLLPDIEMCPLFRTLMIEKFKEYNLGTDGYDRRYVYLPTVIKDYITKNIAFRTKFQNAETANFVFGIEFKTDVLEHLSKLIDEIVKLIPEPYGVVRTRREIDRYERFYSIILYIGKRDPLDNSPLVESGMTLEYIGIYENQFVVVVYNKNLIQMGYTFVDY